MKWFAEQTKSTYQSEYPVPGGILDFDPPNRENGEPRTYTLAEIFDIINDVLICEHKFILLRSEKTLTLFPADAEIPASFFQRVRLHDLKYHAKSELVEVAVKIDPRFAPIARNGRDILPDWPQLGDGYALVQSNVRSVERFLASGYFSP
jgi:hypothetical protein